MSSRRRSVTREARQRAARAASVASRRLLDRFGIIIPPGARPAVLPREGIVAMPARGEILYRLLSGDEPRERDFLSNLQKERPCVQGVPHIAHCGLSMYEHPDQALHRAHRYPLSLGAVHLEAGVGFYLAKTYGAGHYTVWGDPERLLERAELVTYLPVDA